MKSILTLVGMAVMLDSYAKTLEAESAELDIAGFNVKRASLFLQKLQNDFTDSIVPAVLDVEDANLLDFGIKIKELKEDIQVHVKSLDVANPDYSRLIQNALSAIEEAELWFDEHIKCAKEDVEHVLESIKKEELGENTENAEASDIVENPDKIEEVKSEEISPVVEEKDEVIAEELKQEEAPMPTAKGNKKKDS